MNEGHYNIDSFKGFKYQIYLNIRKDWGTKMHLANLLSQMSFSNGY